MQAVIMAGGQGERLKSLFPSMPKALLPLGDRAILDLIIESITSQGGNNIIICSGHLGEQVETHLNQRTFEGVKITILQEHSPMGTAGALGLIREHLNENFIVVNCDLIMDFNFKKFFKFHCSQKAAATSAFKIIEHGLPYGMISISEGNRIEEIVEKPHWHSKVLLGVYAFNKTAINSYSEGQRIDMPDLLRKLMDVGLDVIGYEHTGPWKDIGTPHDYQTVCNEVIFHAQH